MLGELRELLRKTRLIRRALELRDEAETPEEGARRAWEFLRENGLPTDAIPTAKGSS